VRAQTHCSGRGWNVPQGRSWGMVCVLHPLDLIDTDINSFQGRSNRCWRSRLQTISLQPYIRSQIVVCHSAQVSLCFRSMRMPFWPYLRFQRMRLQLLQPSSSVSLNLTLFHLSSDSKSIGKHIITSGPYSDTISGVVTPQVSLSPGTYLLVPSTYHPAIQIGFRLTAYCSTANVNITLWTPRSV
jgi:hypothetical protein